MTDFAVLLEKRRSIRDYEDREVTLEIVKEIIRESCLAPSSGNGQSWRFIIVNNREVIKILSDESKRNLLAHLIKNPKSPSKKYIEVLRDPDFNVFYNAPCLVYLLGHMDVRSLQVDCALAACYFMFSALEKGLGTCWIGLGKFIQAPDLRLLIGMPDDCQIVAPIIIGYPKDIPEPTERMEPQILKIVS
ncbi:nitroreductase family protein [Thermodesulfobacteriota bacterium]